MSIRIRIDGLTLPDRGTSLPLSVEHDGKVCMGAKIVGEAVYIPSKADCFRAMTDEELAEFFANKQIKVEDEIAEKGGFSDHISTKPTVSEWLEWLREDAQGVSCGRGKDHQLRLLQLKSLVRPNQRLRRLPRNQRDGEGRPLRPKKHTSGTRPG